MNLIDQTTHSFVLPLSLYQQAPSRKNILTQLMPINTRCIYSFTLHIPAVHRGDTNCIERYYFQGVKEHRF